MKKLALGSIAAVLIAFFAVTYPQMVWAQGGSSIGAVGTISGEVKFAGTMAPKKIEVDKDQETCGKEQMDAGMEGSGGKLGNVLVSLADVKGGKRLRLKM